MRRLIAPLLAAALLCAGCSNGYGSTSSGGVLCTLDTHIELDKGVVVATATATCKVPPTRHHLSLHLLYQLGGANPPAAGVMNSDSSDAIPGPAGVTLSLKHTCLPGMWSLTAAVAGASPDGTPFSASDTRSTGSVSVDDCKRR